MSRDRPRWQPPPLPPDPAERRRIGIQLLILAGLGLIGLIVSAITR